MDNSKAVMITNSLPGENKFVKLDDCTINYDDKGIGTIPVIFIHGFPFNKTSWQPQMDFMKSKTRVIAYDIRGFGNSTSGREKESISLFADDLIEFMDSLGIQTAVVCGLSMGGYVILNAVSKYSSRFEAIVLCDTQCIADTPEVKQKRIQSTSQIMSGKIKEFAEGFMKNLFSMEVLESGQELKDLVRSMILSTSSLTITRTLKALAQRHEMCSILKDIALPSLIICGNEDKLTPLAQSEYLHKNISNSELRIIKSAGHLSNLEQPEEFNSYLSEFYAALNKQ